MNTDAQRWVLASGNPGKLAELRTLLTDLPVTLLSQAELGVADPEETGLSFVENALLKARHAAAATGLPAIADDSGLVVDALGGAPGLHTARYAGIGAPAAAHMDKLLQAMQDVADPQRSACFVCVLVYLRHAQDPLPLIAQGVWPGRIAPTPRGTGGFGYDPLFIGTGDSLTAAELTPALKHARSHRAQALRRLREELRPHGR